MPTTTTPAEEHQARWDELVRDPSLRDLPYKVETNAQGQIVLSPNRNRHTRLQKIVQKKLDVLLPGGEAFQEWAIATEEGVKVPDVIWASLERQQEMEETGDPATLAPEICVEVLSSSNTGGEIRKKRALYLETGAEEVWVVDEDERVRFFAEEEMERSELVPDFPEQL
jgi:Uma2 family endonuclease